MPDKLNLFYFSQKFRVNMHRISKAWKEGKSDAEIAAQLGIAQWKLNYIRRELQQLRWKATLRRQNKTGT